MTITAYTAPLAKSEPRLARNGAATALFAVGAICFTIFTGVVVTRDAVFGVNGLTNEHLRLLAVPLTLFGLVMILGRRREAGVIAWRSMALVVLVVYAWCSYLWSVDPPTTVLRSVAILMTMLAALGLAAHFSALSLVRMTAIVLTVGTGASVFQFMIGDPMVWDTLAWGGLRGAFSHKNLLGQVAAMAVVLGAGLLFIPGQRVLGLVCVLLALRSLHLANSATAMAAAAAGLGALGLVFLLGRPDFPRAMKPPLLILSIGAIGVAILSYDFIVELLGRNTTLTGRDEIWRFTLDHIAQEPIFGHGFRAFWTAPSELGRIHTFFEHEYDQSHSSILQTLLDLGIVGFSIFATWVLLLIKPAIAAFAHPARRIMVALLACIAVNSLTEAVILSPTGFTWLIMQIAAFALVAREHP